MDNDIRAIGCMVERCDDGGFRLVIEPVRPDLTIGDQVPPHPGFESLSEAEAVGDRIHKALLAFGDARDIPQVTDADLADLRALLAGNPWDMSPERQRALADELPPVPPVMEPWEDRTWD